MTVDCNIVPTKWESLSADIPSAETRALLDASQALDLEWKDKSHAPAKEALKNELFDAQKGRCAYCRMQIDIKLGHYEIEHILPKGAFGKHNWTSNLREHRRATPGYPKFMFNHKNLVLACKRCNSKKLTYDCLTNRSAGVPAVYPSAAADFEWVHPYYHDFSQHISILKGLVYSAVNGSPNGIAVIEECRLDEVQALERTARDQRMKASEGIYEAIFEAAMTRHWNAEEISDIAAARFPEFTRDSILESVRALEMHRYDRAMTCLRKVNNNVSP